MENLKNNKLKFFKIFIVIGSFIVYFIADGVSLSFGIFTREFIDYFKQNDREAFVFITTGLLQAVPLFLSPIVCILIEKYNCRPVALVGSGLIVLSFVLTRFFAKSLFSLNLIIGIILSTGLAMIYIPSYLIISIHYDKRRALATGIAVSGSGLGLFVLSPVSEYLIDKYGWLDACFIFGAISSHTFISACLYRPVEPKNSATNDQKEVAKKSFLEEIKLIYKNKRFVLVNLSYFLLSFVIIAPYNFIPSHIKLKNLNDPSSYSISLIGISTLIGQIAIGFISDISHKYNWLVYAICIILAGVFTCLLPLFNNIYIIYIYSVLFGFTTSVNYVLQSSLVIESIGLANLTIAFGCLQLCQGFSILFGTPLLGKLKDITKDYDKTFYLSGFVMLFSGFLLLTWPFIKNKNIIK